jgi:hypothetical protein
LQVKKHQDLSQSYALAAQELGSVESLALHVTSDELLSKFVSQAEDVISREHTLWVVNVALKSKGFKWTICGYAMVSIAEQRRCNKPNVYCLSYLNLSPFLYTVVAA